MPSVKSTARWIAFFAAQVCRWLRLAFLRLNGVAVGNGTMISMGAKIDTHAGKVTIGSHCHITHGCVILGHDGAAKQIYQLDNSSERVIGRVVIEDHVFVGVNTVILCNVTIGHHSVIGAGSVVRDDIPPYSLAVGNPARVVRRILPEGGFADAGKAGDAPTSGAARLVPGEAPRTVVEN